jgi:DNA-binding NarL/FixJ family response regulator
MALRCLIVDDQPSFCDAARELLEDQGLAVVGCATSSAEALRSAQELRPDVALVDLDLGPDSGFDLARRLAEVDGNPPRVILVSTHNEWEFAKLIESSPAIGFVAKTQLSAARIRQLLDSTHGDHTSAGDPGDVALRCLIVDDQPSFCKAAQELLESQGLTVVGYATSSVEALRSAQELRPDVALVDLDLGPDSGFDLARRLAEVDGNPPRVILVSSHDEREFAKLIESSPAIGFVAKTQLSAARIRQLLDRVAG